MASIDSDATEQRAIELVERHLWPDGPVCPRCGGRGKAYRITGPSARPGLIKCGHCRRQYTVRVGTFFEGSHIPLYKWMLAVFMMCESEKGVTARQLQRSLGISYKSAWLLCRRIRYAMTQEPLASSLREVHASRKVRV